MGRLVSSFEAQAEIASLVGLAEDDIAFIPHTGRPATASYVKVDYTDGDRGRAAEIHEILGDARFATAISRRYLSGLRQDQGFNSDVWQVTPGRLLTASCVALNGATLKHAFDDAYGWDLDALAESLQSKRVGLGKHVVGILQGHEEIMRVVGQQGHMLWESGVLNNREADKHLGGVGAFPAVTPAMVADIRWVADSNGF